MKERKQTSNAVAVGVLIFLVLLFLVDLAVKYIPPAVRNARYEEFLDRCADLVLAGEYREACEQMDRDRRAGRTEDHLWLLASACMKRDSADQAERAEAYRMAKRAGFVKNGDRWDRLRELRDQVLAETKTDYEAEIRAEQEKQARRRAAEERLLKSPPYVGMQVDREGIDAWTFVGVTETRTRPNGERCWECIFRHTYDGAEYTIYVANDTFRVLRVERKDPEPPEQRTRNDSRTTDTKGGVLELTDPDPSGFYSPEDFYDWYYDDFYDFEEAEEWYYSHGGK